MRLARRGGGVVAVLALWCVAAACSGGGTTAPPSSSGASTTVAAGPGSGPTASAAPSTAARITPTTAGLAPQPTPDAAATALLNAWHRGDRVTALRVASADAVEALFAHPPAAFSDRGCQDPLNGQSACAFAEGSGLVQLHTVATLLGGWIVQSVDVNS